VELTVQLIGSGNPSEEMHMTRDIGFWQGIADTARGRGQLRLILQPTIAILLGLRLGIADAKAGDAPFLLRLFVTGKHRAELAKETLQDVLIPFAIAILLDSVLQYLALGYVRPLAAVVVGAALIWIPFSVSRALTNRIYRHSHAQLRHEGTQ
jgi:hypothetical protein